MKFTVIFERTELIEITVDAHNAQDAEVRALIDGEETASKTTALKVVDVSDGF